MAMMAYDVVKERIRVHPRTWLVTGVAGFIGSNLLETLLLLEQNVVGLDNFSSGNRDNLAQVQAAVGPARWAQFRFIEGDVRTLETCREACRAIDIVLHEAALGSVVRSIEDPVASNASNVTGFVNMLVAARDAGVARFVYAGSSAVYGDHPGMPKVEGEIGRPLSPYGLTKYVNELYAEVFARCYGTQTVGLRYFNVFGPRQDPDGAYAAVIPKWVSDMIHNRTVYINGDGETARDFCFVDNVVQANILAATVERPEALNQIYNVAAGEQTSLNDLCEMIRALLAPRFPHLRTLHPEYRDFRQGDVRFSRADVGKALRLLGYRPALRVQAGLERAIDWYVGRFAVHGEAAIAPRAARGERPRAEPLQPVPPRPAYRSAAG
jgi:UDP-N-acetylglucosamine 4-epimerase